MGDSDEKKKNEEADSDSEEGGNFSEMADRESGDPNGELVSVDSKDVGYVIMNPDFYKDRKKENKPTGTLQAYEYITRKPPNR